MMCDSVWCWYKLFWPQKRMLLNQYCRHRENLCFFLKHVTGGWGPNHPLILFYATLKEVKLLRVRKICNIKISPASESLIALFRCSFSWYSKGWESSWVCREYVSASSLREPTPERGTPGWSLKAPRLAWKANIMISRSKEAISDKSGIVKLNTFVLQCNSN